MFNLFANFKFSMFTHYEDKKGNAKCSRLIKVALEG